MDDSLSNLLGSLATTWGEVEKAKAETAAVKYSATTNPPAERITDNHAPADSNVQAAAQNLAGNAQSIFMWSVGAIVVGYVAIKMLK